MVSPNRGLLMRVPAVAIGSNQSSSSVAIFSYGELGQATAGLLASAGHRVQVLGTAPPPNCEITTQNNARYSSIINVETPENARQAVRESEAVLACVGGTEYGAMCEDLAPNLASGQTLFLVGAAFGAALEVDHRLSRIRGDLSLNIVEIDQPFASCSVNGTAVRLTGVKNRLVLAGRSLNETRAGLSLGSGLFNNLVPASNLLERGFANIDRWLQTAAILFETFGAKEERFSARSAGNLLSEERCAEVDSATVGSSVRPAMPMTAVLNALRSEVQTLARAYGVSRLPESTTAWTSLDLPTAILQRELGRGIIEDFIILSSLARMVYLVLPMLESVIELSSVVTGTDLRKEGRELSDLGLIGMDAREIMEHVSA